MSIINLFISFVQRISRIFSIKNKIIRIIIIKIHSNREKIITFLNLKLINSFLSAFIRIFNNFFLNQIISKKKFLIIKVGFARIFEYYPFLNLDYYFRENFALEKIFKQIVDLRKINLNKESCEEIEIRYLFDYILKNSIPTVLQRWNFLLIPGGKLIISFHERSLIKINYSIDKLLVLLKNLNFHDITINIQERFYEIVSYKKREISKKVYPTLLLNQNYLDILSNNECVIIVDDKNVCNLKDLFGSDVLKLINKNTKLIDKNDLDSNSFPQDLINKEKIIHFFLFNLLEFNFKSLYPEIFKKIKLKFGKNLNLHFILPNKDVDHSGYLQFFNKGIVSKICDDNGLNIERIETVEKKDLSQYYITTSIKKEKITRKEKICCLGYYSIRYTQLGYHWDGQVRAFDYLGYNKNTYLDLRNESYFSLKKKILNHNPNILWVGFQEYLPFLVYIKKEIKKRNIKVLYWYTDVYEPKILPEMGDIIDFIFITNRGLIPVYKDRFKVQNVFYMPQACTPPFMNLYYLKEIYDIGYAGKRDILFRSKDLIGQKFYYDHNTRTILLNKIAQKYKVKNIEGEFNNISEFYSQCKFVFGGTPHLADLDLYVSNRFFIAGGCGAVHLTSYFKGIEELVENEKHILWFKNENELYNMIDKYINNKKERYRIRKNALELFHKKHTYINRIQNIFDIINNKTTEFYGFL